MNGPEAMKTILRTSPDAVSPVVAEILLVAIAVVLAAVIYLMASSLLSGNANPAPVVALAGVEPFSGGSFNSTFPIADASRAVSIHSYRFNLWYAGKVGNATGFAATGLRAAITVNGVAFRVLWQDIDGGGTLSRGDTITVTGNGVSLPGGSSFDFVLLWTDGSQLTHQAWSTP